MLERVDGYAFGYRYRNRMDELASPRRDDHTADDVSGRWTTEKLDKTVMKPLHFGARISRQVQSGGPCLDLSGIDVSLRHTLSLIHISEPTRLGMISYAVFCFRSENFLSLIHI